MIDVDATAWGDMNRAIFSLQEENKALRADIEELRRVLALIAWEASRTLQRHT